MFGIFPKIYLAPQKKHFGRAISSLSFEAACTICNVSHYLSREQNKIKGQQNNAPGHRNNGAAGYQGSVKIELLKGVGPL